MTQITPTPSPFEGELQRLLVSYRAKIADLVEDRHNHGITTEQLRQIDSEAKQAILAVHDAAVLDELLTVNKRLVTKQFSTDSRQDALERGHMYVKDRLAALQSKAKPKGGE